jgi:cation diffusion facilitator CzcD-associated flavoprotein CzcO
MPIVHRGRANKGDMEEEAHGVIIVGGGICGLATSLALHW